MRFYFNAFFSTLVASLLNFASPTNAFWVQFQKRNVFRISYTRVVRQTCDGISFWNSFRLFLQRIFLSVFSQRVAFWRCARKTRSHRMHRLTMVCLMNYFPMLWHLFNLISIWRVLANERVWTRPRESHSTIKEKKNYFIFVLWHDPNLIIVAQTTEKNDFRNGWNAHVFFYRPSPFQLNREMFRVI